MNHETIIIILSLLIPMMTGFIWIINRIDKLRHESQKDINEIKKELSRIDSRLSRLAGSFYERGYWESRNKTIGGE